MMVLDVVSPFSISHKWRFEISNEEPEPFPYLTENEKRAVDCLKEIGVIGGNQLTRIFFAGDKKKTRKMLQKGIIVQHSLRAKAKDIPFYTLSPYLIDQVGGIHPSKLSVRGTLSRMVFFQLYARMKEIFPVTIKKPDKGPHVAILERDDGTPFHIGVVRGNVEKWEQFLKWEYANEKIILVAEQLSFIKPLEGYLQDKMIRVTTDIDLKDTPTDELFYQWDGVKWVKDM
ncbi:putative Tudor domain-containing protein [Brevibacillus sp. IT-7CA2]|uniref:hypothetical protein n=1 Tax=Brevibacillus sp. IT-7CA2 TaxID=3026436 RepID=UPI0039E069C6